MVHIGDRTVYSGYGAGQPLTHSTESHGDLSV
jgi:hypothetical protein